MSAHVQRTTDEEYLERVNLALAPSDDDLPRGMAIRLKEERERDCHAFAAKVARQLKR